MCENTFRLLMRKTAYAASPKGSLNYFVVKARDGRISVTASDGFRLAQASATFQGAEEEIVVPVAAAKAVARKNPGIDEALSALRERHIHIKPPNYDAIIPGAYASTHAVRRRDLMDAIGTAMMFAPNVGEEEYIIVNAREEEIGFCGVYIDARASIGSGQAYVRASFLKDAVRACAGARLVKVCITKSGEIIAFKASEPVESLHLVAGLRPEK